MAMGMSDFRIDVLTGTGATTAEMPKIMPILKSMRVIAHWKIGLVLGSVDWAQALTPVEGQIHAMGDFLRAETAAGRGYLPAGANVLPRSAPMTRWRRAQRNRLGRPRCRRCRLP